MPDIILKPGREKSVLRRHPWIFSGGIKQIQGSIQPGETVDIISSDGTWLARGAYSHYSQIAVRIWTWNSKVNIDASFFLEKIKNAVEVRKNTFELTDTNAVRLVHGESDGLPGLIIDRYDDLAVIQYLSTGSEIWREIINDIVPSVALVNTVYERSDTDSRKLEGLPARNGLISGVALPEQVIIRESGLNYQVDIEKGHKTGFYLDQRANRLFLRSLSHDKDVLDCFSYTGGFAINAHFGGARSILAVDESKEALELISKNLLHNKISQSAISCQRGDVFQVLRELRDRGKTYDLIILDPPKFAPTTKQVNKATRGYKDINLLAMKLLNERGLLLTFSCSGGVSGELFQKIIAGAALDSGINLQIVNYFHQAADHPVAINFPEGAYLKGLLLRRVG